MEEGDEKDRKGKDRGKVFEEGVRLLCRLVSEDPDDQIRFQSCLSIAKIAKYLPKDTRRNEREKKEEREKEEESDDEEDEDESTDDEGDSSDDDDDSELTSLSDLVLVTLTNAIRDSNRYVRGYALEALKRLPPHMAESSTRILFTLMSRNRWCSLTTPGQPW